METTIMKQQQLGTANTEGCTVVQGKTQDGSHVVGIGALKVVIVKDGPSTWFAQGLDIDYSAGGTSVESVKKNFENGLIATIDVHLKAYNNIAKILKPAPQEIWQEMFYGPITAKPTTVASNYYQISVHSPDQIKKFTLFENIEYFELALAA